MNDPLVQRGWVPLFTLYDVTLVISGHSHLYEHHRVAGVDYVVTGGGGRFLHRCARRPRSLLRCEEEHHFLLVEIRGGTVRVEAILRSGATLDEFRIAA